MQPKFAWRVFWIDVRNERPVAAEMLIAEAELAKSLLGHIDGACAAVLQTNKHVNNFFGTHTRRIADRRNEPGSSELRTNRQTRQRAQDRMSTGNERDDARVARLGS